MFDRVEFALDGGYTPQGGAFTVVAHDNSPENVYIQKATLDGAELDRCWLDHSEIAAGATLELWMGPEPNMEWGK